jgi:hypothetical protein
VILDGNCDNDAEVPAMNFLSSIAKVEQALFAIEEVESARRQITQL